MHFSGQRNQLVLSAERQVTSSGLGGFVKADQSSGNWSYALSELSSAGVDLEWRKNYSIEINNIRTSAGVWLQRNINQFWTTRLNFKRNNIGGGIVESARSDIVGLTFIYTDSDF